MPQSAPNPTTPYLPEAGLGDSVLKALAATTPELPRVRLDSGEPATTGEPPASAGGSTAPEHRYQIEGEIARGGMGAVLRGRDEDLGREIALKVMLETHRGKTELLQRFVEEAQIAGQLQHPGITPVYELGQFPDRRPYFTMKLVRGQTLAQLLASRERERPESSRERAELPRFLKIFEQICQTLAYAHARRVLHRDLKPANIMVGAYGEVQVMDWGLAKVLGTPASPGRESGGESASQPRSHPPAHAGGSPAEDSVRTKSATPETEAGSVMGTPSYMAPEQARGEIDQLDERADVFGLGAILCEILTGKPPYVGASGVAIYQKAAAGDLADAFARLDQSGADADLIALAKRALAANPDGRPRDAGALTAELTAYLNGVEQRLKKAELATAQAKTKAEEETKRRQLTFKLAAAILVTLLAGLAGSLWFLNRSLAAEKLAKANEDQAVKLAAAEKDAKDQTQRRLAQIEKGTDLLASIFENLDPRSEQKEGKPLRTLLGERLDKAAAELKAEAVADPLATARLQHALGGAMARLGRPKEGLPLLEAAAAKRQELLGPEHSEFLTALNDMSFAFMEMEDNDRALELAQQVRSIRERTLGADHPQAVAARNNVASLLGRLGKFQESAELLEQALASNLRRFGPKHVETLRTQYNLGGLHWRAGERQKALPLMKAAFEGWEELSGAEHPDTAMALSMYAEYLREDGRVKEALPLSERALRAQIGRLGADHPEVQTGRLQLGLAYVSAGEAKAALPHLEEALKKLEAAMPVNRRQTALTRTALAQALEATGQAALALPQSERALADLRAALGDEHPDVQLATTNLGTQLYRVGRLAEAQAMLQRALLWQERRLGLDHPSVMLARNNLAQVCRAAGQLEEALRLFGQNRGLTLAKLGPKNVMTLTCAMNLASAHQSAGRMDRALPLFEETAASFAALLGPDHPTTLTARHNVAVAFALMERHAEAIALWLPLLKLREAKLGPNHPDTEATRTSLATASALAKRLDLTAPLLRQVEADQRRRLAKESLPLAAALAKIGLDLLGAGLHAEAEPLLREALALRQAKAPDVWTTFNTQAQLGLALLGQKKDAEGEPLLVAGYEGMAKRAATIPPQARVRVAEACERLIQLHEAAQRPDSAARLKAELAAHRMPPKPPAR